jgi:hypothetical protein
MERWGFLLRESGFFNEFLIPPARKKFMEGGALR